MSLTAAQKAMRRTGISGSEMAAVLGLHPYMSAMDVWRNKVLGAETPETMAMEIGSALEPGILSLYMRRKGLKALLPGTTVRHPKRQLILATPDAMAPHEEGFYPVEAKASSSFTAFDDYGADGTDEVPEWHRVQVTMEAGVTLAPFGDLVALLGGRDVRIYRVPFDAEYFDAMCEIGERFFRDHIATEKPPDPDGSESWSDFIKERFQKETAPIISATHDMERWASEYLKADTLLESAESAKRLARQNLELACAEAAGIEGDGWKLSWKSTKPVRRIDWEALCVHLGAKSEDIDAFTATKPGARPFRLHRKKA